MKDRFNTILFTTFAFLVLAIGVLAVFSISLKPVVKKIDVVSGTYLEADAINQKVRVSFSHPIKKQDITKYLRIEPAADFDLFWKDKELTIAFTQNLKSNTSYTVLIDKDLQDTYNQALKIDYSYTFKTRASVLFYIEQDLSNKVNRIVSTDTSFENKTVWFEHSSIQLFSQNQDYIAVVTPGTDRAMVLSVIEKKSRAIKIVDFNGYAITHLALQPHGKKLMVIASKIVDSEFGKIPSETSLLYSYDINRNTIDNINPNDTANYSKDLIYSSDGSALLYQGDNGIYYLVNANNYEDLVVVGRHEATGGFNGKNNKVVFNNFINFVPNISTYATDKQEATITDSSVFPIDPVFMNTSDAVIFSNKVEIGGVITNTFEIKKISPTKEVTTIIRRENNSLELPKLSSDDRFMVVEEYVAGEAVSTSDFRHIGLQLKPGTAKLLLYDMETQTVIDKNITGINAVWAE